MLCDGKRRQAAGRNGTQREATGRLIWPATRLENAKNGVHRPHEVRAARIGGGIALALRDEVR